MSRLDDLFEFRVAERNDIDAIMEFIRDYWKRDHILATDKDFFLWQFGRDEYGDTEKINIVIMTAMDGRIVGMIGFVPYTNDPDNLQISTVMTKISPEVKIPMAGIEMIRRQMELVGEKANFSSGTNAKTLLPIFEKIFHRKTGVLQKYYMLNPEIMEYRIAVVDKPKYLICDATGFELREIHSFSELESDFDLSQKYERMSQKSSEYIKKRFFDHPIYDYRKWMICNGTGRVNGVLFGRELYVDGNTALRLVDYRGDLKALEKIGDAVNKIIIEAKYEYAELQASDLSFLDLSKSGFLLLDPEGDTIIPDYFEPFVQSNILNWWQTNKDIVIFRADGDQDRPSMRRTEAQI